MDITVLTQFLSPFLPLLLKLGGKAAEKATESAAGKFGEASWKKAEAVWERLQPQVDAQTEVKAAIEQVAAKPESEARQAVFREELEALFKAQPDLLSAIAQILQPSDSSPQIQQNITGGNVFNITGSSITNLAGSGNINYQPASSASESPEVKPESRSRKTILILSANPKGTNTLRLAEEVREIQRALERSQYRDDFKIEPRSSDSNSIIA